MTNTEHEKELRLHYKKMCGEVLNLSKIFNKKSVTKVTLVFTEQMLLRVSLQKTSKQILI